MPKTVQIRNIDDDTYLTLTQRAAEVGLTVPEFLRQEAERLAARPSLKAWSERTRRRPSAVTADDVAEALDAVRGPWPNAGR